MARPYKAANQAPENDAAVTETEATESKVTETESVEEFTHITIPVFPVLKEASNEDETEVSKNDERESGAGEPVVVADAVEGVLLDAETLLASTIFPDITSLQLGRAWLGDNAPCTASLWERFLGSILSE